MSVVVAIKEGDKVFIGADSQVTKGGTRTTLKNPNNYKIWKVDGLMLRQVMEQGGLRLRKADFGELFVLFVLPYL